MRIVSRMKRANAAEEKNNSNIQDSNRVGLNNYEADQQQGNGMLSTARTKNNFI